MVPPPCDHRPTAYRPRRFKFLLTKMPDCRRYDKRLKHDAPAKDAVHEPIRLDHPRSRSRHCRLRRRTAVLNEGSGFRDNQLPRQDGVLDIRRLHRRTWRRIPAPEIPIAQITAPQAANLTQYVAARCLPFAGPPEKDRGGSSVDSIMFMQYDDGWGASREVTFIDDQRRTSGY